MSDNNNSEPKRRGRPRKSVPSQEPNIDELEAELDGGHTRFRKEAEDSLRQDQGQGAGTGEVEEEIEEPQAEAEDINAIPEEIVEPLEENVIINDYKNETVRPNPQQQAQVEVPIPEPIVNPAQVINPNKGKEDEPDGKGKDKEKEKPEKPKLNPDFDDLSPSQKRKNAEKDADAIITTWANFLPVIPKKMAKFNIPKLERMEMKGEIEMGMVVFVEDGTTFRQYCEGHNNKVDAQFVYTQEMRDAVKEPLVEVLLEKQVAMTPMQRLIKVGVEQMLTFGAAAYGMMMDNKNALNQITEELRVRREAGYTGNNNNTQQQAQEPERQQPQYSQPTYRPEPQEPVKKEEVAVRMDMENVLEVHDNSITLEEIVPDEENN